VLHELSHLTYVIILMSVESSHYTLLRLIAVTLFSNVA